MRTPPAAGRKNLTVEAGNLAKIISQVPELPVGLCYPPAEKTHRNVLGCEGKDGPGTRHSSSAMAGL